MANGDFRAAVLVAVSVLGFALPACTESERGSETTTTTTMAQTTTTTLAQTTTTQAVTLQCQMVGFTPNSEDAASEVTATGLTCADAEAFVRIAGARTSSGGPQELDVSGYHCVRTRSEEDPLPRSFYECTNGSQKVTFVRS
jgi:hypothetical protein